MKSEINETRYVPSNYNGHREDAGLKAEVFYTVGGNEKGHFFAIAYRGKGTKPYWHHRFATEQSMRDYIEYFFNSTKILADRKAEEKAERKANQSAVEVKVGMLFCHSWGYDQTNIDFYQVIEVKGKQTAVLRRIGSKTVKGSEGYMCSRVLPVKDAFIAEGWRSEPITKRIRRNGNSLCFTMECGYAGETTEDTDHYCSWYA